ncbi:PRTRC system protein D [Paraburkholderia sp.]|uniref:PRTRC system protein D n=1 Tax=Paraburkholderia sp. TaxID=1926495 RepID=UPI003C7AEAD3
MESKTFALDIGYGNTKCAYRKPDGKVGTDMFPSLAPFRAPGSVSASGGAGFGNRDVVTVTVNGTQYEVGPDVPLNAAYGETGRVLIEEYVRTDNYAALLAGAVYRAGFSRIRRLILGLPVHTMERFARELKERFTGKHEFGHGPITIDAVSVVPQPLGSMSYASSLYPEIRQKRHDYLLIDVGYFTTDWVYVSNFMVDDRRSGGRPGGSSHVLQRIAANIGKEYERPVDDIERIDVCLREKAKFRFFSHELDLAPYLAEAQQLIKAVIMGIGQRVGALQSVESIILTGGGSDLYYPALREMHRETRIQLLESPCFANAVGFLLLIESMPALH